MKLMIILFLFVMMTPSFVFAENSVAPKFLEDTDPIFIQMNRYVEEAKQGKKGSLKKLYNMDLDGAYADAWPSYVLRMAKEAPNVFYLELRKEKKSVQESILYSIVKECVEFDHPLSDIMNPLDALTEKYARKKKMFLFLQWCRTTMKDLIQKGFED